MGNDNHKLGDEAMALVRLAQRSAGTASETELTRQAGAARDIVIRAWINGRENGRPPLADLERVIEENLERGGQGIASAVMSLLERPETWTR